MNQGGYQEIDSEEKFSPWSAYSDLLCSLLMVFILLLFYFIYQYLDIKEKNELETEHIQSDLYAQQALVTVQREDLERQEAVLALLRSDIENQEREMTLQQEDLKKQEAVLALLRSDIENQEREMTLQKEINEIKERELAQLRAEIEEKERENIRQLKEIDNQASELRVMKANLEAQQADANELAMELADKEEELKRIAKENAEMLVIIDGREQSLTKQAEENASLASQITIQISELAAKEQEIARLSELAAEREAIISRQELLLADKNAQLENIVGVRSRIIQDLYATLSEQGTQIGVDTKTGAITFDSSVLFEKNSATLSEAGEEYIRAFFPVYYRVLFQPDYADYIAEIIIEGHTDTDGSFLYNLDLSQRRALAVASYCVSDDCDFLRWEEIEILRTVMTANGRSYSQPILKNGVIDKDKSRRVEVKFRLKDQDMIDDMQSIFEIGG